MDWLSSREKKIALTVFLISGLFVQWYGVNANSRFDLTRSVVDHGTLNINEVYRNAGDRSYYEGDYYSDKEPGMALLATPIYAGWKSVYGIFGNTSINSENRNTMFEANNVTISYPTDPGKFYLSSLILVILFTSTLSLSILSILIYRLSEEFIEDERKRLIATFGFAFGTLLTHYGTMLLPNAVVTFFSFSAFYLIYQQEKYNPRTLLYSGILLGFGFVIDPTAAPVAGATFIYTLIKYRQIPYTYVLGGFIGALPLLIYNTVLFGYPWMLPRFFLDPALYPNIQQSGSAIPMLTEQGFRLNPIKLFFVNLRLLFFPYRGIFYWFPFLIVSFFGLRDLLNKEKGVASALGITAIGILFVVSGWWAWWMGGFFGARYLSVLIPFLMFPIFYGIKKLDIRPVLLLVSISILVNLAGFQGSYEDQLKNLENSSEMKEKYSEDVRSFEVLENPVRDYYLNGLVEKGPQSKIVNEIYNGNIPPDIRAYRDNPKSYTKAPFLIVYSIILGILGIIWNKEIRKTLSNHREKVLEKTNA